jgi:inorganic pyrophosphatase
MDLIYLIILYASVILALVWSVMNSRIITSIKVESKNENANSLKEINNEDDSLVSFDKISMIRVIGERIAKGANAFLIQEYSIMLIFICIFSIVVLLVVDIFGQESTGFRFYATSAFIVGSFTSILCGWIGMTIAVKANFRTTFMAM